MGGICEQVTHFILDTNKKSQYAVFGIFYSKFVCVKLKLSVVSNKEMHDNIHHVKHCRVVYYVNEHKQCHVACYLLRNQ